MSKRKQHTPEFKAKVALEAVCSSSRFSGLIVALGTRVSGSSVLLV